MWTHTLQHTHAQAFPTPLDLGSCCTFNYPQTCMTGKQIYNKATPLPLVSLQCMLIGGCAQGQIWLLVRVEHSSAYS